MTGIAGAADYTPPEERGREDPRCFVCGGPWAKGDASFAAKAGAALPGSGLLVVEVCSAGCAQNSRFSGQPPPRRGIFERVQGWWKSTMSLVPSGR